MTLQRYYLSIDETQVPEYRSYLVDRGPVGKRENSCAAIFYDEYIANACLAILCALEENPGDIGELVREFIKSITLKKKAPGAYWESQG